MSESVAPAPKRRTKFLVVADETPECRVALRFASRRAERTGGGLALLQVIEPPDFQHWLAVEEAMREEAREEAEQNLMSLAGQAQADTGITPEIIIREGSKREELLKLIEEDPDIRILVLAAAAGPEGPGPLVTELAGQKSGALAIPITVVPGALTDEQIDELS
jgi:nucleotide-binding universal stress UspA family protein